VTGAGLPRLPRALLSRPRLDGHLDEWAPLTVLHGPEGYGKTTLVTAWLDRQRDRELRPVYVAADPGDVTNGFAAALRRGLADVPVVGDADPPGVADPARALARLRSAAELAGQHRLLLVIDDAQHLTDHAILAELVTILRRHRAFHLVVCARGRHPIEKLADGRVDRRTVPADELLCTPGEVGELAALLGAPVGQDVRDRLHAAVAGWIAPVRLALEAAASSGDARCLDLTSAQEYLSTTVLQGFADRATLLRAMRLALVEDLDTDTLRAFVGGDERCDWLGVIEASGLLARSSERGRTLLRFPALIRQVLRTAYAAEHPDDALACHRHLAAWYGARLGNPSHATRAFVHAVAGRDWPLADRVWCRRGSTLTMEYPRQVEQALAAVPAEVLAERPAWQLSAVALPAVTSRVNTDAEARMATLRGYVAASRATSRRLETLSLNDLLTLGTWRVVGLRARSHQRSAGYAATLHTLVAAGLDRGEDPGDRLPGFWLQRGLTHTLLGEDAAARSHYLSGWYCRTADTPAYVCANLAANLALTHAVHGRSAQARRWLARRAEFATEGSWGHRLVDVGSRVASGLLALDRLDPRGSAAEAERLGHGTAPLELWPFVAHLHARHALYFGDPEAALAALDEATGLEDDGHAGELAGHWVIARARADLLMASGRAQAAHHALRAHGSPPPPGLAVGLARAQLLTGDLPGARGTVAGVLSRVSPRDRLAAQLVDAVAALRMGCDDDAVHRTRQALESYRRTGILAAFATVAADDLGALFTAAGEALPDCDLAALAGARVVYPAGQPAVSLTRRERTLVRALRGGRTRQETAAALHLSLNTVKSQYASLYRKLRVNSRGEALMRLDQLGL